MSIGNAFASRPITCPAHPRQLAFRTEDCVRETALLEGNTKCCAHRCQQPSRMCQVCLAEGASYGPGTRVLQPTTGDGFCEKHRLTGVSDKVSAGRDEADLPPPVNPPNQPVEPDISARLAEMAKQLKEAPVILLHPRFLRPMPGQPRVEFDPSQLEALAAAINDVGQIQPIVVRLLPEPDGDVTHEIVDGERRWRAAIMLQGRELRCQVVGVDDLDIAYLLAVISNFNRVGHTHWEVSCSFQRMRDIGLNNREISRVCGRSEMYVGQMLFLQQLHPDFVPLLQRNGNRSRHLPLLAAVAIAKAPLSRQPGIVEKYFSGQLGTYDLRDAVVSEAKSAGSAIRERRQEPARVLQVLDNRVSQISDSLRLMKRRIGLLDEEHYLGRSEKLAELVASLELAQAELAEITANLKEKAQKF